jgi:hypothetical protein
LGSRILAKCALLIGFVADGGSGGCGVYFVIKPRRWLCGGAV